MIISDHHQFAFIHIPKCAGTTVRSILQPYDDKNGAFTNRIDNHPELGRIDYVHIPLFILNRFFPTEYTNLQQYWSFAVLRDPFKRFPSAVSQRLRKYTDQPIQNRPIKEVRNLVDESINYLARQPSGQELLPPDYIHFQRQADYIFFRDQKIIDNLYTLENIETLLNEINRYIGHEAFPTPNNRKRHLQNQTYVFRNELLRATIQTARPFKDIVATFLPEHAKQLIRNAVYVPRDRRMHALFTSDYVRSFIRDFYQQDVHLYNEVRNLEASYRS